MKVWYVRCPHYIMQHMEDSYAEMIGAEFLTPKGERVRLEGVALDDRLPPRAIVYRKGATNLQTYWLHLLRPIVQAAD